MLSARSRAWFLLNPNVATRRCLTLQPAISMTALTISQPCQSPVRIIKISCPFAGSFSICEAHEASLLICLIWRWADGRLSSIRGRWSRPMRRREPSALYSEGLASSGLSGSDGALPRMLSRAVMLGVVLLWVWINGANKQSVIDRWFPIRSGRGIFQSSTFDFSSEVSFHSLHFFSPDSLAANRTAASPAHHDARLPARRSRVSLFVIASP